MSGVERAVGRLERAADLMAGIALIAMMLVISADALGRLFGAPLQGAYEFTAYYLMVVVAFMALPRSYVTGGQVRLELMERWLKRVPGNLWPRLVSAMSLAAFGVLLWFATEEALRRIAERETTFGVIQWPLYLSYLWMPLGVALLSARLALDILRPREAGELPETAAMG
ncbi:MAG: TRAP transporter small permease, partial [Alphaproteobacteria bacterium]|nr:TRAP transporter small permease [Alphaproteobacteria bacterium]